MSQDIIAGIQTIPQTLNRYAYVINNPQTLTDPTGEIIPVLAIIGYVIIDIAITATVAGVGYAIYKEVTEPGSGYTWKGLDQVVRGKYTDAFNFSGLMLEIALGCTPIGWLMTIRDTLYDLTHLSEHSAAENAVILLMDAFGLVPVLGKAKKLTRLSKLMDNVPSSHVLSGNPKVHINANAASLDSVPAGVRNNTGMPGRGAGHTGASSATSKQHSSAERYLAGRSQGPGGSNPGHTITGKSLKFDPSSPELFPVTGQQRNIVQITMQGSRGRDFTAAYKAAGIKSSQAKGYTWHHLDDFNPKTGTTTMQLVKTQGTHKAIPHSGSVSQFEKLFRVEYGTQDAIKRAFNRGWVTGRKPL